MAELNLREFKSKLEMELKKSSSVFVMGHNEPDFDAIGSAFGLYVWAVQNDKNAYIIVDDDEYKIEPGVKKIIDDNRDIVRIINKEEFRKKVNDNSILIVTDTNKKSLISLKEELDKFRKVIVIDHHTKDEHSIKSDLEYIDQSTSSASEIVARLLNMGKIKYSSRVANYLLAGISLDTKRFKQNTTSTTHDVAEKLLVRGADIDYVNNLFLEEFENYCRISNLIINGTIIKKYTDSLAPITVSFTLDRANPKTIYLKEDYAKAADRMMKFNGIDASFALGYVDEETVHISARGGKKVNVGKIMEQAYGGGNFQSAGGRVVTDDITAVENLLMEKVPIGVSDEEEIIENPPVVKKVKQMKKKKYRL